MDIIHQNLRIRNATPLDAEILCGWWNDGRVMAHAGFPNGLNTTSPKIAEQLANDSDDTYRRLIIEADNSPIGEMSYRNLGNGVAEIGIKICEFTKQEQGLGTTFLRMFISSLFWDYSYQKIVLDTNLENTRAQHVYEKLGFRKIRVNTDAFKNQVGEWQSSVDYELTLDGFIGLI